MAWNPPVQAENNIAVNLSGEVRQGVRFDLYLDDKNFAYSRTKTFAVSDPLETVVISRHDISGVMLKKLSPIALRIVGALLIAATVAGVTAFMVGTIEQFPFVALLGFVLGGACFMGSSNRWKLEFTAGGKRHSLVQPVAHDKQTMVRLAEALQLTGKTLGAGIGPQVTVK